jgi:phosphatidylserine/phosphatidylglycerophosphate/cardiolipin synthase-like enzyme
MKAPLLALTTGELERLAAELRASSALPGASALNQQQIAHEKPLLRQELIEWLNDWSQRGGSNGSLELAVNLLLEQRQQMASLQSELVWSGPSGGAGDLARDQAVLMREMIERCEQRLLITTFNIYRKGFIKDLLERIQQRMVLHPDLEARMVVNIPRPKGSRVQADQLRADYAQNTWGKLWKPSMPRPSGYFDPRSLDLQRERPTVFHVKCCVADDELLVTSANLSDSAQFDNCELGIHFPQSRGADDVWDHFDRLIQKQPAALAPIEKSLIHHEE